MCPCRCIFRCSYEPISRAAVEATSSALPALLRLHDACPRLQSRSALQGRATTSSDLGIQQLTRITVSHSEPIQPQSWLEVVRTYDIVAVQPKSERAMHQVLSKWELSDPRPIHSTSSSPHAGLHIARMRPHQPRYGAEDELQAEASTSGSRCPQGRAFRGGCRARKNLHNNEHNSFLPLQILYSTALRDPVSRRHLFSNAQALTRLLRGGRGALVISSGARNAMELRGPAGRSNTFKHLLVVYPLFILPAHVTLACSRCHQHGDALWDIGAEG